MATALKLAALLALGLGLSACGEDQERSVTVPTEEGTAEVTIREGDSGDSTVSVETDTTDSMSVAVGGANAALPDFARLPAGAQISQSQTASSNGQTGGIVTFSLAGGAEAVVDHYRTQAEAAGLATALSLTQGAARVYGAEDEGGERTLSVVATPGEGGTEVQVTWSGPA